MGKSHFLFAHLKSFCLNCCQVSKDSGSVLDELDIGMPGRDVCTLAGKGYHAPRIKLCSKATLIALILINARWLNFALKNKKYGGFFPLFIEA